MPGDSRPVTSSQRYGHPRLGEVVSRHLSCEHQRPIADHTRAAFAGIELEAAAWHGPLVFDSFCGTGMSTAWLAEKHPDSLVIGIDKSARRLDKHPGAAGANYRLVQADCGDFWRLAYTAGWTLARHYLFYPNPWPKSGHLRRRVHGSPALHSLLLLGGQVELRSNWQLYVEEFGCALHLAGYTAWVDRIDMAEPVSLFERKYFHSGHQLWRCRCNLGNNVRPAVCGHSRGIHDVQF